MKVGQELDKFVPRGKKIYFASDFHLGAPDWTSSLRREKLLVSWLDMIKKDASEIYLMGDVFDFWFEYSQVVPRGHVRLLGKLAELSDAGIIIHYFTGNHDMWVFDYLPLELDVKIYRKPIRRNINNKEFYIAHGDGLGPGDHGYKFIKKVFANKICQFLFRWIHPDIGIGIANFWSRKSRDSMNLDETEFLGEDKEWLVIHSKELLEENHYDYFVYGHRHVPITLKLKEDSAYINLGDWIEHFTYGEFDGEKFYLKDFYRRRVLGEV